MIGGRRGGGGGVRKTVVNYHSVLGGVEVVQVANATVMLVPYKCRFKTSNMVRTGHGIL